MDGNGHQVHTAAVFVTVDGAPVRASVDDAEFYVQWMDNLLTKTAPGGVWNSYFENNLAEARARYQAARAVFQQIALEAGGVDTPPTVISVSPANGATNVNTGASLTVTFSEPMDPATIDESSFELRNASNQLLSATVAYNGTTNTATLAPAAALANSATYTARVIGGAGGVTDSTGTPMSADYSWSFTTAAAGSSGSSSLWDDTVIPAILSDSDTSAVELGVKFQSDVDGYITALRFYKSSTNTGTHVGNLWSTGGTLLASVTFANETASGWQEMALSNPVAITAGTTYIASYHAPVGRYSADSAYFTSAYNNSPLTAPSSSASGGNGVYLYGGGGFPNQTYNASNYWVDVVFQESLGPPDNTAPTVTGFTIPSTAASLTVAITSLTAIDNVGVTGYLVTESSTAPSATAGGWSAIAPASSPSRRPAARPCTPGPKTPPAMCRRVSVLPLTITLSDAIPPTVTAFTVPSTATTLTVTITSFTATDNVGVTGYLVTESSTAPSAGAGGWSANTLRLLTPSQQPATKTLYAWAKDAVGNVSASVSASVTITLSDTTPPVVNSTAPSNGATGVSIGTQVVAIFSEPMNPATITATTFTLNGVTAAVAYNDTTNTATLTPRLRWPTHDLYGQSGGRHQRGKGRGRQSDGRRLHLVLHHRVIFGRRYDTAHGDSRAAAQRCAGGQHRHSSRDHLQRGDDGVDHQHRYHRAAEFLRRPGAGRRHL